MKDDYRHSHTYGSSEQVRDFQVDVSLKLQEALLKKSFIFDPDDKIWYAKIQVIHELAKGVKDVFNYGFYEPPNNGRAGKFLDEERTFKDYPQRGSPVELEFKYKRRVYKSLQYDSKTLQKIHTKSNLKKLLECVSSNNVTQVSKWTEKGLDPNFQDDKSGETPLTIAVTSDDRHDLIVMLVNGGAHLDYRAGDGLTPMHKAALAGKAGNVKILLDLGCPPNIKDPKGLTPLYYSVLHGGDPYCTELLLNEHAQMGVTDHQGMQEIHHACKKGLVQHLEHLVFYGANIDATTASGNTPLHITSLSNHEECARVLLFRGARRDILNYANQSAYEVAAVAGNKELAEFIRRFSDGQIVKFTEKPTYSTRRRKVVPKPRANSLFEYHQSNSLDTHSHSSKSDSSLPPSPRSLTGSRRSISNAGSLEENGAVNGRLQRSTSVCSTASESSYTSDPEDMTLNERRSRAQENRTRDMEYPSGKMAPPVKIVSGAASVRKRLYAANAASRRYIAVKDYVPCRSGELQLERGDIVEVLYVGERGFWEGRVGDRKGWFPSVCIEELKKGEKQRPRTLFGRPPSFSGMFAKADDPRAPSVPDRRFIQQPREVILNRGKSGFGFQMRGANCQTPRLNFRPTKEFPALQYIGEVEPGGEADIKGVKNDDFIIEVNNEDVTTATHSHVVNLIKRSGNSVKLKIVTVPVSIVNGVDTLDFTDAGHRGKVPPPLPQRDPSTTLTLGRMRTSSRPSLFDAGLVHSHEEPASFKVDSVIAVSKDSQWSTLQRRKPSDSNSRSAAQFKFNSGSRSKLRSRDSDFSLDKRSRSMQNIASLSRPYESATVGRAPRPRSTAVPFAIPQVPERFTRSMSQGEDTLSKPRDFHAYSDPNILDRPSLPTRSVSVDESRYNMNYETNTTNFNDEETIVATPVGTTVSYVEDTRTSVEANPIHSTYVQAANGDVNRQRKHSLGSSNPLYPTSQRPVETSNERIHEQGRIDRKISAPASVTSQRRRAHTSADRLRSDIMSQLKTQLNTDNDVTSNVDGVYHGNSIDIGYQGNTTDIDYRDNSVNDCYQGDAIDRIVHRNTVDTVCHGNAIDIGYHGNSADPSHHRNTSDTEYLGNVIDPSHHSNVSRPSSAESNVSSPSKKKDSPKKLVKPPISKKPAAPPPPPPVPPTAPPLPVAPTVKPSKPVAKGKNLDIPQTAVRQGLITVDALQAKKGKLKAIQNNDQDSKKNSNSIHAMVGQLAGQGGRAGAKPAPAFGGNQHAHMLAKAVAARAAKLANEANDSEHDSPSSWEDDTSSPNIPRTSPPKPTQTSPKKTPPPVAPKKTSGRRSLFPPRIGDLDRPCDISTEEDRTMMIFDDIIRKEVESENWSLNSWNSSDSSSLAEGVLPPGTYLSNSIEERPRKSSFGSGSRPWYEYSSGSPSEESLSASSERISQFRPSISLDEGTTGNRNRINDLSRRYSDEDGRSVSSTLTRDSEIDLVPVSENRSHSVSNCSMRSDEISKDMHAIDNRMSSDDLNERFTPTNNMTLDDSTGSHSASNDSDVVEKTITTQSGIKIKLLLNKSPDKKETSIPLKPSPLKDVNKSTSFNDKTPLSNHVDEELTNFLPPPPMDFTCQDVDNIDSPPLPPPPEFLPIDNNDFNSPLPAPPIDFCDDDTDPGSLLDVPAINSKQLTGGSTFQYKALLEWNCDDVCDWLDSLNLSQYQDTFRENDIKGLHLPELTKADLLELGIKSLGHRMTMENSVAKLCQPMESSC